MMFIKGLAIYAKSYPKKASKSFRIILLAIYSQLIYIQLFKINLFY